jgi:hypothetical protein
MRSSRPADPHACAADSAAAQAAAPVPARAPARSWLKRTAWFVALWCAGVAGALLLALPFRLLMHAAMH